MLGNDTDPDGDTLTVVKEQDAEHGRLTLNEDGSFEYVPTANYNGPDSFTYRVSDGHGGGATATVSISVRPINDSPSAADDTATTDEDRSTVINLLANDSDADGDTL